MIQFATFIAAVTLGGSASKSR